MTVLKLSKVAFVAALWVFALAQSAFAMKTVPYEATAFKAAQDAGQPLLIDVYAPWCSTCRAQHQALEGIKDKPEFEKVTVFQVDYDTQKDAMQAFNVNQRSTLIGFKGATETGRFTGVTDPIEIEKLVNSVVK